MTGCQSSPPTALCFVLERKARSQSGHMDFRKLRQQGLVPDVIVLQYFDQGLHGRELAAACLGALRTHTAGMFSAKVTTCSALFQRLRERDLLQRARELFQALQPGSIVPTSTASSAPISACEKGALAIACHGVLRIHAARILGARRHHLQRSDPVPARKGRAAASHGTLRSIQQGDLVLHSTSGSAPISACEKVSSPQRAMDLFESMQQGGLVPNVTTFSAPTRACEKETCCSEPWCSL